MAMAGLVKGTLGVVVRPAVGMLELVSKGTHGMGLVCLGREAITGSAQRRVRAPGALVEEQTEVSPTLTTHQPPLPRLRTLVAGRCKERWCRAHCRSWTQRGGSPLQAVDDARIPEMQAAQRSIVAAWQSSLPHMFPQMKVHTSLRLLPGACTFPLCLSSHHLALCRIRSQRAVGGAGRHSAGGDRHTRLEDTAAVQGACCPDTQQVAGPPLDIQVHVGCAHLRDQDCERSASNINVVQVDVNACSNIAHNHVMRAPDLSPRSAEAHKQLSGSMHAGEDDKLRINLEHASKYDTKCLGVWTIPRRKVIKCGSRDLLDRVIVKVNRHMSSVNAGTEPAFSNNFDTFRTADLSIYNAPYSAAPPGP